MILIDKQPHNLAMILLCIGLALICHRPAYAQQLPRQRLGRVLAGCGSIRVLARYRPYLISCGVEQKLPFAKPIYSSYSITSTYGLRMHPIKRRRIMHDGYDLSCPLASRVHATADGIVCFSGWCGGYGNCVIIRHLYGFETLYAHLARTHAYVSERIWRGDVIGFVGSTGLSTGNHLHYEIRKNGKAIEPIML